MKYITKKQQNKIINHYIYLLQRDRYTSWSIMRTPVKELSNSISRIQDDKYFIYSK